MSAARPGFARASLLLGCSSLLAAVIILLAVGSAALAHPVRPPDRTHPPSAVERAAPDPPRASAAAASSAVDAPTAAATTEELRAHPAGEHAAVSASPEEATVAIVLLGAVVAMGIAARHRRLLALALILIAGLLAFEGGVHSVHHLDSPGDMSRCAVAVAAAHVPAAIDAPPAAPDGSALTSAAPPVSEPHRANTEGWRAWRGRAPPLVLA